MTGSLGLRIGACLLCLGLAGRAGEDVDPVGVAPAPASPLARLRFAELRDLDASGGASAGDHVVLGLRRPLAPRRVIALADLGLAGTAASWGEGAVLEATPGESEVRVVLGEGARLGVSGTYRPAARAETPAQLRTGAGAVPILAAAADRRAFAGDRFADSPELRPFYGQLHAHTGASDGELAPADAYASARRYGLDFFAVTDHLEQLTPESWEAQLRAAHETEEPGVFAALSGYEWGGFPTLKGWMNHVNVVGSERLLGVGATLTVRRLYEGILALPGATVIGQFNHPGMRHPVFGKNNWNDFEYDADADRRMRLMMVETRSELNEDNRETSGYIPALDRGWHLAPKGEEDNHRANWGHTRKRTGIWLPDLSSASVLAGLTRMATFYTDDPDASLKLRADGEWLMGSTVYGDGRHRLEVEVAHRTRAAVVSSLEIVSVGGVVVAHLENERTPVRFACDVAPRTDAYFFARVVLEGPDDRMISAPIFVDR
ncbi:MAG TPA: CehA/McbA family metallohydrolase [Vicinamibacteria bacterium]|nr:CehA/McbA family metallohydrolase [Vicinamibacteria bacterium]